MSKRISPYIRDITAKLLKDYCEMNEYDISRAVDELLYGRLSFLEEAKKKAKEKAKKKQTSQEWFDEYWNEAKENYENNIKEKK